MDWICYAFILSSFMLIFMPLCKLWASENSWLVAKNGRAVSREFSEIVNFWKLMLPWWITHDLCGRARMIMYAERALAGW